MAKAILPSQTRQQNRPGFAGTSTLHIFITLTEPPSLLSRRSILPVAKGHPQINQMPDPELKILIIHAKHHYGRFYVALVPASLDHDEIHAAFDEVDLDVDQVAEICEWRTTSQNVTVAFVPFPGLNFCGHQATGGKVEQLSNRLQLDKMHTRHAMKEVVTQSAAATIRAFRFRLGSPCQAAAAKRRCVEAIRDREAAGWITTTVSLVGSSPSIPKLWYRIQQPSRR